MLTRYVLLTCYVLMLTRYVEGVARLCVMLCPAEGHKVCITTQLVKSCSESCFWRVVPALIVQASLTTHKHGVRGSRGPHLGSGADHRGRQWRLAHVTWPPGACSPHRGQNPGRPCKCNESLQSLPLHTSRRQS